MATKYDLEQRKGRLDAQINQINELVHMYENNTRATDDILKRVNELEDALGQAKNRKSDAESTAATFDREFIERKAVLPDPFKPDKLYTIQDFTLFFFFLALSIFILAMSLTLKEQALKIIIGGGSLIALSMGLILRFA